jgi:hypothetical protein
MVRGRLRNLVNIVQVRKVLVRKVLVREVLVREVLLRKVELSMLLRVAVVSACLLGAGIVGVGAAIAEDLAPEQARAFVVGKLFAYNCFEGTTGVGRVFADGSVVGTIKIRGQGETRFAALPAGTIKVEGTSMCAHLSGLPITPCFRVQRLDYRSFRGSLSGLGFAYCDFYQRNPRVRLTTEPEAAAPSMTPSVTPVANTRPVLRPSLQE